MSWSSLRFLTKATGTRDRASRPDISLLLARRSWRGNCLDVCPLQIDELVGIRLSTEHELSKAMVDVKTIYDLHTITTDPGAEPA